VPPLSGFYKITRCRCRSNAILVWIHAVFIPRRWASRHSGAAPSGPNACDDRARAVGLVLFESRHGRSRARWLFSCSCSWCPFKMWYQSWSGTRVAVRAMNYPGPPMNYRSSYFPLDLS